MSVIRREQCPQCKDTGNDNLVFFEDGGAKCYACGLYQGNSESSLPPSALVEGGTFLEIRSRGISKSICEFFDYKVIKRNHKTYFISTYRNEEGIPVAQKIRSKDKKFTIKGDSQQMGLFGMHLWEPNPKLFITITEGEEDALSVACMQGTQFPVVSVPNGAAGAAKSISKNAEYLSKFKHVVLCFDNDSAGEEAAKECSKVLKAGTVKVARLPLKDANEMLLANRIPEFKSALFNAKCLRPDGIVGVEDVLDKILERPQMGLSFPWTGLTELTYGIRPGNIYTIGAGSGSGKSAFVNQIVNHICFTHKEKVGMCSFESTPKLVYQQMAGTLLGRRIHVPSTEWWDEEQIKGAVEKYSGLLYVYDHKGSSDLKNVLGRLRHFVLALGCKVLVLDPFTRIAGHFDKERQGIDRAMSELDDFAMETGTSLILVSHLAKPLDGGKTYEEGRKVTAAALRGSQHVQYSSSFIFGLERDKYNDDEKIRTTLTVRILKDRFTGESDGKAVFLRYNTVMGKLEEVSDPAIEEVGEAF